MSLGYSVGDIVAFASLIERIAAEVRSYRSSPLHFQRLAIELDFLSQVCTQVFELRPILPDEELQIDRIRAIAMQCLGPLRAFEAKMKKYENTLGLNANRDGSRKKNRWGGFRKRLHWSSIARHEVDQLRAILTSEILAINTLLTMHEWASLQAESVATQHYSKQMKQFVDTTQSATVEIWDFLVGAKMTSELLEEIVLARNRQDVREVQILETMACHSYETQSLVTDLSQQQTSVLAKLQDTMSSACSTINQVSSIHRSLESWIKNIVQYYAEIITMIERNTRLLLSLYGILAKLERTLSTAGIDLPILEFETPLRVKMALPFQLCETWEGLRRLLTPMYADTPGSRLVANGRFFMLNSRTSKMISPQSWSSSVGPGDRLTMSLSMVRFNRKRICPGCGEISAATYGLGVFGSGCPECHLWSSTAKLDKDLHFSTRSEPSILRVPLLPSELFSLCNPSFITAPSPPAPSITGAFDSILATDILFWENHNNNDHDVRFRDVHVIPYQGHSLDSLSTDWQYFCEPTHRTFPAPGFLAFSDAPRFQAALDKALNMLEGVDAIGPCPWAHLPRNEDN